MQIDFIQALKNYLAVFNVPLWRISPPFDEIEDFDYGLRRAIDPMYDWKLCGKQLLESRQDATLFVTEDVFGMYYALFPFPLAADTAYLIGPWRGLQRTPEQTVWAQHYLGPDGNAAIQSYFEAVPYLDERTILGSISALVAMLYPPGTFRLCKLREYRPLTVEPDLRYFSEPTFSQKFPAAMLEQRYAAENALCDAVALGDEDAAMAAFQQFRRFDLGERFTATLRHRKNALIILNTLLRKSIERANVHPYYLDAISTKYSLKIETITSAEEQNEMDNAMLKEYCAYVRRYSVKKYSPLVQKVINHINLNLDSQLSLKPLAEMCFISPSYLSNLFKQETGSTLTDYINTQRVQRAAYFLQTTASSISTIAESVGILDVNYFTKIFKKIMGVTPTQYRRDQQGRLPSYDIPPDPPRLEQPS